MCDAQRLAELLDQQRSAVVSARYARTASRWSVKRLRREKKWAARPLQQVGVFTVSQSSQTTEEEDEVGELVPSQRLRTVRQALLRSLHSTSTSAADQAADAEVIAINSVEFSSSDDEEETQQQQQGGDSDDVDIFDHMLSDYGQRH